MGSISTGLTLKQIRPEGETWREVCVGLSVDADVPNTERTRVLSSIPFDSVRLNQAIDAQQVHYDIDHAAIRFGQSSSLLPLSASLSSGVALLSFRDA